MDEDEDDTASGPTTAAADAKLRSSFLVAPFVAAEFCRYAAGHSVFLGETRLNVSKLGRRIWEDVQIGLLGALLGSVILMLGEHLPARELLHRTWRNLLEMVPCAAFGTELARGIHWLFKRYKAKTGAKTVHPTA